MLETFTRKNIDYGNSFEADGVVGTVIRIGDKLKRLKTISEKGHVIKVKDEKLLDTLMDLANYAAMGVMLLKDDDADEKKEKVNCDNHEPIKLQQSKDDTNKSSCSCGTCSAAGK